MVADLPWTDVELQQLALEVETTCLKLAWRAIEFDRRWSDVATTWRKIHIDRQLSREEQDMNVPGVDFRALRAWTPADDPAMAAMYAEARNRANEAAERARAAFVADGSWTSAEIDAIQKKLVGMKPDRLSKLAHALDRPLADVGKKWVQLRAADPTPLSDKERGIAHMYASRWV